MAVERVNSARSRVKLVLSVFAVLVFVIWAHFGSGVPVIRAHSTATAGWADFLTAYGVDRFGADGYFTRGVQNGYNLFHFTPEFGGLPVSPQGIRSTHALAAIRLNRLPTGS